MSKDPMLGGESPFWSPSEAVLMGGKLTALTGYDHKPTRFSKDGVDHTRLIALGLLACAWYQMVIAELLPPLGGGSPEEIVIAMIASANTDLQQLGIAPLISIEEVKRTAPIFARKSDD